MLLYLRSYLTVQKKESYGTHDRAKTNPSIMVEERIFCVTKQEPSTTVIILLSHSILFIRCREASSLQVWHHINTCLTYIALSSYYSINSIIQINRTFTNTFTTSIIVRLKHKHGCSGPRVPPNIGSAWGHVTILDDTSMLFMVAAGLTMIQVLANLRGLRYRYSVAVRTKFSQNMLTGCMYNCYYCLLYCQLLLYHYLSAAIYYRL